MSICKLVGTDGKQFYSLVLTPGKYMVGRNAEYELSIRHKTVSRNHAEIEVEEDSGKCYLTDLGSRNGTFINGQQLTGRRAIKIGDEIMFGQTEFKLTDSDVRDSAGHEPNLTRMIDPDLQNSVFMSIDEALMPLRARAREKGEILSTMFDMAKMLVLPEPKEVMLEKSLELVSRIIPAERLAVLFVSDETGEVFTGATLLPGGKDPGDFKLSRTIVNQIIHGKNSILIRDPHEDPRFADQQSIIMSELKSALAVPLFDVGRVLGILYADSTSPLHQYTDEHLRILASFGNIIASRLLNYELLTERQQKQILDAELSRASAIQKNLLLSDPPETEGYQICTFQEQSRSVGGDLYDIGRLPDGRTLFLLADVSGKGMGAALLMSNILASFRILYDSSDFDLTHAVERVSSQLFRHSDPGDFATLFIGLLEPGKNIIRYINAGHNPPLLVRKNGEIEHLMDTGMVIGVLDIPSWKEKTATFNESDILFVFTDGITEAQHEDEEEQFGDERLEKLIVENRDKLPDDIVRCLMDDINDFMGDAPRSDDITILAIKKARQ